MGDHMNETIQAGAGGLKAPGSIKAIILPTPGNSPKVPDVKTPQAPETFAIRRRIVWGGPGICFA